MHNSWNEVIKNYPKIDELNKLIEKIDEKRLVFQEIPISDAFIVTADKPVPYFQLAASTYRDKCTLSACTYASGKSFDLLCSIVNNIRNMIEDL